MQEVIDNLKKSAPKWFRKLKGAVSIATDTAIVFVLANGHTENSFIMLVLRIGIGNAMKIVEGILVDKDEA